MVFVRKHSGELEEFKREKVKFALLRSGASEENAEDISQKVLASIHDGIHTSKVYSLAYNLLQRHDNPSAARFGLKAAIMRLGPTGFPFEKYVARVLDEQGYKTSTNNRMDGKFVTHEVDIVAERDGLRYMIECKYHNQPGFSSGLKESLYTWARFDDLVGGGNKLDNAWIITNTKITSEAVKYADGKGMLTTSWGYPEKGNLQDMIEGECMYPITLLRNVSNNIKESLSKRNIMLVKDILKMTPEEISNITRIKRKRLEPLIRELHALSSSPKCANSQ
jgi:hypothetical protein